jgi:ABC-2 type transport system permease protein
MAIETAPTAAVTDPGATHRQSTLTHSLRTIGIVALRDLIRLRRMPTRIVGGLVQPLLFLLVLGAGLSQLVGHKGISGVSYQEYIFPGVLAMSVIASSLFAAIAIVWDREFGFMREMLVAPVSRTALVLGKAVGGGSVAIAQGVVLIVLAPVVGVHLTVLNVLGLLGSLVLLALAMTAFGIVLASRMRRMESFQMVMALVLQPMVFLSGAVFPLQRLPGWLALPCRLNPATYGVDLARRTLLGEKLALTIDRHVVPVWGDVAIVLVLAVVLLTVATRLFGQVD